MYIMFIHIKIIRYILRRLMQDQILKTIPHHMLAQICDCTARKISFVIISFESFVLCGVTYRTVFDIFTDIAQRE